MADNIRVFDGPARDGAAVLQKRGVGGWFLALAGGRPPFDTRFALLRVGYGACATQGGLHVGWATGQIV